MFQIGKIQCGQNILITCYDNYDATLVISYYENDILTSVSTQPVKLIKGETIKTSYPYIANVKLLMWDKDIVKPLCLSKTIN